MEANNESWYGRLRNELDTLDNETVEIDGKYLKASQCYHVGTDPTHILFNTNCPEIVRQKVTAILERYRLLP